jgi:hypothetical protein
LLIFMVINAWHIIIYGWWSISWLLISSTCAISVLCNFVQSNYVVLVANVFCN